MRDDGYVITRVSREKTKTAKTGDAKSAKRWRIATTVCEWFSKQWSTTVRVLRASPSQRPMRTFRSKMG